MQRVYRIYPQIIDVSDKHMAYGSRYADIQTYAKRAWQSCTKHNNLHQFLILNVIITAVKCPMPHDGRLAV